MGVCRRGWQQQRSLSDCKSHPYGVPSRPRNNGTDSTFSCQEKQLVRMAGGWNWLRTVPKGVPCLMFTALMRFVANAVQ